MMKFGLNLFKRLIFGCFEMPPTSRMHISVVGTGQYGTPKSLLICTDTTRYIINCGEGTQRILTEHKSKASRIQHAFFTKMSWDYYSGLLGVALTVKTAGVKKMFVHGAPASVELMKLTRHFADASTTDVVQSNILEEPFIDQDFKITAFRINKSTPNDFAEPSAKRQHLENQLPELTVYAFLFQMFRVNNKLDPEKCSALGIPKHIMRSPAIRKLIEGEPLILECGRVISPSDATVSAPIPRNFLVLDCPSKDYLQHILTNSSIFHAIGKNPEIEDNSNTNLAHGIGLVVHFLPPGLFTSPEYQQLIQKLNEYSQEISEEGDFPSVQHLVLDGSSYCPPISGIYSQATVLNKYFDNHAYPALMLPTLTEITAKLSSIEPFSKVAFGEPLLKYQLRPPTGFCSESCLRLCEDGLIKETFDPLYVSQDEANRAFQEMQQTLKEAALAKHAVESSSQEAAVLGEWPELIFLGTASSSPSKYRNISAILLRLSENTCVLLDCGEGTLNQLYALYGLEETHRLLRGLRLILITHMHADHHGGVLTIGMKHRDLMRDAGVHEPPLLPVLSPPPFWKWTHSFSELFCQSPSIKLFNIAEVFCPPSETGSGITSFQSDKLEPLVGPIGPTIASENPAWLMNGEEPIICSEWNKLMHELDLKVSPVKVPHTGTSWGFVIESGTQRNETGGQPSRWKIVYSGDTPPCTQLAQAGLGCDLLIHEATMGDGYEEQAVAARHSTTSEAISIGRTMQAKFILLNHFSQRFARLPNFDTFQENIAPTFDFLRVRLKDLWKLPYFLPYYKFAFAKHWEMQKVRSDANQWRKKRNETALQETREAVMKAVGQKK